MKRLTMTDGYDAEGSISPDGKKIVFTSARDGDLEIYDMNIDGTQQRRLTNELGYDGGAWHSQDGQWIVWRASRPKTPEEVKQYKDLFAKNLVMPTAMELWLMRADGTESRKRATHTADRTHIAVIRPRKYDSPAPHLATPSAAMPEVIAYSSHGDQMRLRTIHAP